MPASLTRRGAISIGQAGPERVAVLAATTGEAVSAAREILRKLPAAVLAPDSLDGYLRSAEAPSRVVLCVTGKPGAPAREFLARALQRLLWPPPAPDLLDAIVGLRSESQRRPVPRGPSMRRSGSGPRRALLLEGTIDAARARSALHSEPRDWIVESARHVRLGSRALAALTRAGVVWSALEPVELVAVLTAAALPRGIGLPAGTPVWIAAASRVRAR